MTRYPKIPYFQCVSGLNKQALFDKLNIIVELSNLVFDKHRHYEKDIHKKGELIG